MSRWITAVITVAVGLALFHEWDTFDTRSIRGKRVLITGSSSGIGEQLAYLYSKLGASVVVTGRRAKLLEKVALKCKQLGANKVEYVVADMVKAEDRQRLIGVVEKHLGGLDHLVVNHGVSSVGSWFGSAENMTVLQTDMLTNFLSHVDIASRTMDMLTKSRGNIAVTSSIAGKLPFPLLTTYASSKFALHGFFSSLRQELSNRNSGVSVTISVLGHIATDVNVDFPENDFQHLSSGASVPETALFILKGIANRSYEIYYPFHAKILVYLHRFIPNYVEDYIGATSTGTGPEA